MNQTKTVVQKRISIKNDNFMSEMSKSLYEDTYDENCFTPDLIIKTGSEKYEFFVHRMIFAASSDFIQMVLATAPPATIPVIIIPDLKTSVMKYVLLYVYHGNTGYIPFDKYVDFIEACNLLQLKGPINEINPVGHHSGSPVQDIHAKNLNDKTDEIEMDEKECEASIESDESEEPNVEVPIMKLKKNMKPIQASSQKFVRKNHGRTRSFAQMITLTPETETKFKNQLITHLENTYRKFGILVKGRVKERIDDSRFLIENGKLAMAEHICGLCDSELRISYIPRPNGLNWIYGSIARHILRFHRKTRQTL